MKTTLELTLEKVRQSIALDGFEIFQDARGATVFQVHAGDGATLPYLNFFLVRKDRPGCCWCAEIPVSMDVESLKSIVAQSIKDFAEHLKKIA